jgi:hypothetical protein
MLRARHLFSDFDSLLAISLARNPFFFFFFFGRNYSASTRSTRISSRGLGLPHFSPLSSYVSTSPFILFFFQCAVFLFHALVSTTRCHFNLTLSPFNSFFCVCVSCSSVHLRSSACFNFPLPLQPHTLPPFHSFFLCVFPAPRFINVHLRVSNSPIRSAVVIILRRCHPSCSAQ